MTRILVELYGEVIEGVVVDKKGACLALADVDLDDLFIVRCDDGERFTVHGWLVDVEIVSTEAVH